MNKKTLRNIGWIALLAVWGFWAGAYFNLGWNRENSINYSIDFLIGGIGMLVVLLGIGLLARRFAKKSESDDPTKTALIVVSVIASFFLILGSIKYDDVRKDKFISEIEHNFIDYYTHKASDMGVEIEDIHLELTMMFYNIQTDLREHSELEKMLESKTQNELFENNAVITKLCIEYIEMCSEDDNPEPGKLRPLFED